MAAPANTPANFATLFGIHSHWAPWVFAALYFLMFWYFLSLSMRMRTGVYSWLAFFALMRVTAFTLRGVLADFARFRGNKGIGISYAVLYNVGFFAILLAMYNLLRDREQFARLNSRFNRFSHFFHRGRIAHIVIFIAFALGLSGYVIALDGVRPMLGRSLQDAMMYMFLVIAIFTFFQWLNLVRLERSMVGRGAIVPTGVPTHHGALLVASLLLIAHAAFFVATVKRSKAAKQNNEHLWYPLAALTELLAAMVLMIPGLIISRALFVRHRGATGPAMATV